MPRPATNNPSNLPNEPNLTYDPVRQAELIAEMHRQTEFIRCNYLAVKEAYGGDNSYNESLGRLRKAIGMKRRTRKQGKRLHPEIELVISEFAREFAEAEGVTVGTAHIQMASVKACKLLKMRRGRPKAALLKYHVTGLVAVIQEFMGLPVIASRTKNSDYDRHFEDEIGRLIPILVSTFEEDITEGQLVDIVCEIRREYAGKPLRFIDLFPYYQTETVDGEVRVKSAIAIGAIQPNIPIYCP